MFKYKNVNGCHCERSVAICWIDGKSLRTSARKLTDCYASLAMTAIYSFNHLNIRTGTPEKAEFPVNSSINKSSVKSFKLTPA